MTVANLTGEKDRSNTTVICQFADRCGRGEQCMSTERENGMIQEILMSEISQFK